LLAKRLPPAPASLDAVDRAREAVGRVPDPEDDCCARVGDALGVDRRTARDWLTLLRALGLVERTPGGYRQTGESGDLFGRFRDGVYGAREALAALDGAPRAAAAVGERVRQPAWERRRSVDPARAWRERTERLLAWLTLLGAAERADGGWRAPEDG
jgi:hypothetical protein